MPKKTKKDKIMAQQRRASLTQMPTVRSPQDNANPLLSYTFTGQSEKKLQQAVSEYAIELKTIKSDLYKTIILAIAAFSIELYLYWLL